MRAVTPVISVAPVRTASSPPSPPLQWYQLYSTRALPAIDCTVNVKHVVLSAPWLARVNRFTFAARRVFGPAYGAGFVLCAASLFTSMPLGGWCAALSTPLQLVPTLVALLALRYDMVVLLMKTYEFWYMTLMNLFACACVGYSFGDARWPVVVATAVGFELALLIDANFRRTRVIVVATAFGAVLNIGYSVSSTFGYVHTSRAAATVVAYNGRALQLDDAVLNVLGTVLVLLLRNAYRKHVTTRRRTGTVECVTYRCRLGIRLAVDHKEPTSTPPRVIGATERATTSKQNTRHSSATASRVLSAATTAQLAFVCDVPALDATNVLLRVETRLPSPRLFRRLLQVCSATSLLAIIATALGTHARFATLTSRVAVASALVVIACYAALAQRDLLRRLFSSFDFLFLSVQISITHACVADIVQWSDPRALAAFASWLLTHWVLLLDAVLPVHKHGLLGYHRGVAGAVLVVFLAGQLLTVVTLIAADDAMAQRLRLRDRELFTLTLHGRVKQARVVPVLLGRTLATLSWSLRLLWRLWDCRADELLLLQGRVEFHSHNAHVHARPGSVASSPRSTPVTK